MIVHATILLLEIVLIVQNPMVAEDPKNCDDGIGSTIDRQIESILVLSNGSCFHPIRNQSFPNDPDVIQQNVVQIEKASYGSDCGVVIRTVGNTLIAINFTTAQQLQPQQKEQ
ncbi:hypothetical protein ACTA71_005837 [Dictyostelium dimigraforme]